MSYFCFFSFFLSFDDGLEFIDKINSDILWYWLATILYEENSVVKCFKNLLSFLLLRETGYFLKFSCRFCIQRMAFHKK